MLLADPLGQGCVRPRLGRAAHALTFLREEGVIAPGATVFDLGAHQAVIALMIGRAGASRRARASRVEAEPHNAEVGTASTRS